MGKLFHLCTHQLFTNELETILYTIVSIGNHRVLYTSMYFRDRSHPKQQLQQKQNQKNPKKTTKEHKENFGGGGYCDCGESK